MKPRKYFIIVVFVCLLISCDTQQVNREFALKSFELGYYKAILDFGRLTGIKDNETIGIMTEKKFPKRLNEFKKSL